MGCGSSAQSKYQTSKEVSDIKIDSADSQNICGAFLSHTHSGSPSGTSPRTALTSTSEPLKDVPQSDAPLADSLQADASTADGIPALSRTTPTAQEATKKMPAPMILLPSAILRRGDSYAASVSEGVDTSCEPDTSCKVETSVFQRALTFVNKVPVFQSLEKADLPLIVQKMNTAAYSQGEVVISQGKVSNRLFVILSGEAEVLLREGSSVTKLVTLSCGDYFGEQELLHEEIARATVRVAGDEDLLTYSIAHDKFWELGLHEKLRLPKRRAMVNLRRAWQQLADESASDIQETLSTKTDADLSFVAATLRANSYLPSFCELTDGLVSELASVARFRTVDKGEVLMRQGDLHGACLYMVQDGCFEIQGRGRRGTIAELAGGWEAQAKTGDSFGELELIYSMPCAATVTALQGSTVWTITRSDFTLALDHALAARLDGYAEVLRGVNIFKGLYHEELRAAAAAVTEVTYECGEDIIIEGEIGDTCFVLVEGEVVVLVEDMEVNRLVAARSERRAELFGEDELVNPSPRAATVRVVSDMACVLALDKVSFDLVLEPLSDILKAMKESGNLRQSARKTSGELLRNSVRRWSTTKSLSAIDWPIDRTDLKLLGNLGSGGFGSVELAVERGTGRRFALKCVRRLKLVESYDRRQMLAEKSILAMTRSPFLVRLYGTYRDAKALAFLLELLPGGDLRHAFCLYDFYGKTKFAQFYTAGLVFALEHLHERCIIHRDIKPENVMLDSKGWPKLTDFGLAKFCVGKTFTCVGTPLYMAPEILSEVGHGPAVDWWSLAVVMYEMMAACTPFEAADGDFFKFCQVSKRGIPSPEVWQWPDGFGSSLPCLLSDVLQPKPLRRLPMRPSGITQFKEHSWFDGLNWAEYEDRTLEPPLTPKALLVENLRPSSNEDDWKAAHVPDTDWDADF